MPDPPNYAFEPQSPRDSGCMRMVLAGLLGVVAGVLLTIVVEAAVLPGLFDRVRDFINRKPVAEAPPPTSKPAPKELEEQIQRDGDPAREMREEMEDLVRQRQEELERDLKSQQKAVEGNK